MSQPPTVGRIVHYSPEGATADDSCVAAIVTFVAHDGKPCLTVFYPPLVRQLQPPHPVPERRAGESLGSTWHWPERA